MSNNPKNQKNNKDTIAEFDKIFEDIQLDNNRSNNKPKKQQPNFLDAGELDPKTIRQKSNILSKFNNKTTGKDSSNLEEFTQGKPQVQWEKNISTKNNKPKIDLIDNNSIDAAALESQWAKTPKSPKSLGILTRGIKNIADSIPPSIANLPSKAKEALKKAAEAPIRAIFAKGDKLSKQKLPKELPNYAQLPSVEDAIVPYKPQNKKSTKTKSDWGRG